MNYLYIFLVSFLLIFNYPSYSQSSKVIAGPMASFVDSYGTQIWFLLTDDAKSIELDITDYQNDRLLEYDFEVINNYQFDDYIPFIITLENLSPNQEYIARIYVDDEFVKEIDIFTKRPHLDDVQFLVGYNQKNASPKLFSNMTRTNSDFMVWIGGHIDVKKSLSFDKLFESYVNVRKKPYLNDFMTSMPQIATWSSYDCNFSNQTDDWDKKKSDYSVFKLFWPNFVKKTYNYTFHDYGTYQRYTYNDLDVFLLDAQTFQSKEHLYGDTQIDRLFKEINNTGATFTVIASPHPFTFGTYDSFINFQEEFKYFIDRLNEVDNNGIVLLSAGDLSETPNLNQYNLEKKPLGVQSFVYEFNVPSLSNNLYSLISIKGKEKNRIIYFETYNENGNLIFKKHFHQDQLRF
tara:strand:- start:165 stop:1379 length:1215 start_codon:yes stop_codon:yes gene_type:complete